ncbi:FG-GAP repeat domain-containing protein [Streptomyces sp. NPDC096205]|uniref:FG-GAP repeat domain-containing protein n=1 Tax=Streptomyces sp. NPDC096205 TaxID=3366081 RepID=UPI0038016F06
MLRTLRTRARSAAYASLLLTVSLVLSLLLPTGPATADDGCVSVDLGVYQGDFAAVGEVDCLLLPLPEGARMAALKPLGAPAPRPELAVADADGVRRCAGDTLSQGTCALTGKAPFRVLVSTASEDQPTGAYRIALYRTDAPDACPALPQGDFTADSPAARLGTGDGVFAHCLSIPADAHSTAEVLQLRAVTGTATASVSVVDTAGRQVCIMYASLSGWTTCALTPGLAHTVLVNGRDSAAAYTLTRSDVTATAKGCAAAPATSVGGPSTGGPQGAPGTLTCRQVTTPDARDTLHLNVRDALGTANILAFDAEGKAVCSYRNRACAVTGSTSYQVLVAVPSHLQAAGSYRLDALRIATAAGPAEECVKVPNVSYGYGPITGTFDETHTALCRALPTAYDDRFDLAITDTAGGTETAVPALYDASLDNNCMLFIPSGYQCYLTEPSSAEVSPSILVLGLPEKASQTAYRAELSCTYALCGTDEITVGSVTPATGAAGTRAEVTLTGTALRADDKVRITRSGKAIESTTVSVAADRRSLTAVLDLTAAEAGDWNLSVITHNSWEYPRGTFTVVPALHNTALPAIRGTAQVGVLLRATPGTWSATPDSYAYQWESNGRVIPAATGAAFRVPASLHGTKITAVVTARKSGWQSATAETPVSLPVAAARRDQSGPSGPPDGAGDLLTLTSGGTLSVQRATGTGTFSGRTSTSGWSVKTLAVPFGDLNGDACNDVLVRMPDGTLRGYVPSCGGVLRPTSPYKSLGGGWGAYNVLTSPGDLTGDGRADLIARRSAGGDVYLYAATSDGRLKPGVRIGTGWTSYTKIVGAGDLTDDGHGDLLARDTAGRLWRYDGTGTGRFRSRVLVFSNWGTGYNAVVGVGDITGDGRQDLVARDTAGNLYRQSGNGKGSFGARVRIETGWQAYTALF